MMDVSERLELIEERLILIERLIREGMRVNDEVSAEKGWAVILELINETDNPWCGNKETIE